MKDFDPETIQTKFAITEAAVDLFEKQNGKFTLNQIAKKIDLNAGEIFNYFPNKQAILRFYYTSLVIRYRLMLEEIDDFENYTLSEKLSNFIYASFDMMDEHRSFVDATFDRIIRCRYAKTTYENEIEELFQHFFREDPMVASTSSLMMNEYFFALLRKKYLYLVHFWRGDTSEGHELSMELTDKYTAFLQAVMYSSVADKGFDLIKFMITNNIFTRNVNIPFVDKIFSKIEIRS